MLGERRQRKVLWQGQYDSAAVKLRRRLTQQGNVEWHLLPLSPTTRSVQGPHPVVLPLSEEKNPNTTTQKVVQLLCMSSSFLGFFTS